MFFARQSEQCFRLIGQFLSNNMACLLYHSEFARGQRGSPICLPKHHQLCLLRHDVFIGPAHWRGFTISNRRNSTKASRRQRQRGKGQGQPKTGHFINDDGRGVAVFCAVNPYRAGPMAQTIGKSGGYDGPAAPKFEQ